MAISNETQGLAAAIDEAYDLGPPKLRRLPATATGAEGGWSHVR